MLKNVKVWQLVVLVGSLVFAGAAVAKGGHKHHDGHQLLGSKINTDGKHELHKAGGHTVYAHVTKKKIAKVTVTGPKGEVAVKKYRSSKKLAALGGAAHQFIVKVSTAEVAQASGDYIGYAFVDPVTGDTYIYWFSAGDVLDPSGAEVYMAPV